MIQVLKATEEATLQQAYAIRETVFVKGQGVPSALEHEHDDVAHHFLALLDGAPAGASRWRRTENGYKLERFAVLESGRGRGVATAMIRAVLADLPPDASYIYLNAQLEAVPVYEKAGFIKKGEPFEEAGILHYKMILC